MNKEDEDLRKEIDDLEKLIEEVSAKNKKELERLRKERKAGAPRVIRINLAADYSHSPIINFIVGLLVNFILFTLMFDVLGLATADGVYVYGLLALAYAVFEPVKRPLLAPRSQLMLAVAGIGVFLLDLIFFYAADLFILVDAFDFASYWHPLVFVAAFAVLRFAARNLYAAAVRAIAARFARPAGGKE